MALFSTVVEAFIASRELDQASLSRLVFWNENLGMKEVSTITPDDIDAALVRLAERGRLLGGRRLTTAAGKPLAGSTVNRYLTQAGSVFKHARRLKLVPRAFAGMGRLVQQPPAARADRQRAAGRVRGCVSSISKSAADGSLTQTPEPLGKPGRFTATRLTG
jgi:hypothetical protein